MKRFFGIIRDGKLPPAISNSIRKLLQDMEGKKACIEIKEAEKQRTNPQNDFFHGVILPAIRDCAAMQGSDYKLEVWKHWLKKDIGGLTKFEKMPDGSYEEIVTSSRDLNTKQWEIFMDKIRAWAASDDRLNLQLPYPNE